MSELTTNCNEERLCGNTATGTLKLIAFVLMITDHIGAAFFNGRAGFLPYVPELRLLGRIALPIYAWCLCVGACRTRKPFIYLLRMLAMTAVSQPFYCLALSHSWYEFNIFATLTLGLAGITAIRENRFKSRIWGPMLCLIISMIVDIDYGWQGVLFIILMYLCRKDRGSLIAFMISFCLFWGYTSGSRISTIMGLQIPQKLDLLPEGNSFLLSVFRMQNGAVLSVPFILIEMRDVRLPKWIAYSLYPAHLLVIAVIKALTGMM